MQIAGVSVGSNGPNDFPVKLVCPTCGQRVITGGICRATKRACAEEYSGIPRFLVGQEYWGETPREKMRALLAQARQVSWKESLQRVLPNEALTQHLLAPIRADYLHAMPWPCIREVLDVGAGMGFMACDMARYAKQVVALEAVPERAEFIQIRASQDQLPVFPIIADAMQMPFAPESFDLITLNGVFEYIGLWGQGNPHTLQQDFLRRALMLLRPGGYLYIGIESRFSISAVLGARDHSGLSFTSLMPRWLADAYCRIRARPYYGSERAIHSYRTYTYTPLHYVRMLREAGFGNVSANGVYDGYNRQIVVYKLGDSAGRKTVLNRIDPPSSVAGSARRFLENSHIFSRYFEQEVILFASKARPPIDPARLPWGDVLSENRSVVQVNLPTKILGIVFDTRTPIEVLEIEKQGCRDAGHRLDAAYDLLVRMKDAVQGSPLSMRWPEPLGRVMISGRCHRRYSYITGDSLSSLLRPARYSESRVFQVISQAVVSYLQLCAWMSEHFPINRDTSYWDTFEKQIDLIEMGDDIRNEVRAAISKANDKHWTLSVIHGDFTASNLIVRSIEDFVVLDWEHFTLGFPVGADLIRFQQDILNDSERLPELSRKRLARHLDEVIRAALLRCGYQANDYRDLQSLYVGHQILALGGETYTYGRLLQAFRATRQRSMVTA